jgi:hypothetical protein
MKELRAASEPEALADALSAAGLPLERVGLEACSLTAWLHDGRPRLRQVHVKSRQSLEVEVEPEHPGSGFVVGIVVAQVN